MSMPESPMNPNWEPPPRRPGMSTGTKVLLILLVVGGVLVVLCCGGLIISGYYLKSYVEKAASKDPAVVRQVAARIVPIDLPPDFQPEGSLDMSVPFSMAFAVYADKATGSTVIMAEFGEMFQQNQAQMQAQLEQQMRQQGMARQKVPGSVSSRQKQIQVRGQPVTFTFAEAKEEGTGKTRLDVTGVLPGKQKTVMLMISVDAGKYDEARVTKMLESIR